MRAGTGVLERGRRGRTTHVAVAVERGADARREVGQAYSGRRGIRRHRGRSRWPNASVPPRRGGARYLSASALITFSVMSMLLAREDHRILQDQVEFLGLGDLHQDLVRALLHRRQFLVAAQVDVLAELALHALQVARLVGEVALLVAPLGLAHRRAVLVEHRLQVAHLLAQLLQVGVARREFLLELLLRALGRRGVAEQPLGVDEADLVVGGDARRRPRHSSITAAKRCGCVSRSSPAACGAASRIPCPPGTGIAGCGPPGSN